MTVPSCDMRSPRYHAPADRGSLVPFEKTIMLPAMMEVALYKIGASRFPVDLSFSALIAAVMAAVYCLTLKPFGRMLERHEIRILTAVTTEVE